MLFKLIVLAASLGIDNLSVGVSIGLGRVSTWRALLTALLYGAIQTAMPAIGILAGSAISGMLGHVAAFVGYAILIAVGVVTARSGLVGDHQDPGRQRVMEGRWAIPVTGVALGLDSLAVGFSLGFSGASVVLALLLFGLSGFVATFLGLVLGGQVGRSFGPVAEIIAGTILTLTGIGLALERLVALKVL